MEIAAPRRRRRVRDLALQHDALQRMRGSGSGTAESSAAVYGCLGRLKSASVSASSTIRPTYITATRLLMCRTTLRSCATKR